MKPLNYHNGINNNNGNYSHKYSFFKDLNKRDFLPEVLKVDSFFDIPDLASDSENSLASVVPFDVFSEDKLNKQKGHDNETVPCKSANINFYTSTDDYSRILSNTNTPSDLIGSISRQSSFDTPSNSIEELDLKIKNSDASKVFLQAPAVLSIDSLNKSLKDEFSRIPINKVKTKSSENYLNVSKKRLIQYTLSKQEALLLKDSKSTRNTVMESVSEIDYDIIHFFRKISDPMARFGLFVVFFWFGLLKVIDVSPATPIVQALFENTISFMPFSIFLIFFGAYEMIIGIMFIVKGFEREVIPLLFIHMIMTSLPLFLLGNTTWSEFFVPTMEGQYIIKNLVIIAAAIAVAAHIHPLPRLRLRKKFATNNNYSHTKHQSVKSNLNDSKNNHLYNTKIHNDK